MSPPLSLTGKRWILPPSERTGNGGVTLARLMQERGTHTATPWPSPQIFPDIPKAVTRIRWSMDHGETIGIFGDYDCDGITGVAELVHFFRRWGTAPQVFLPHRVHDGYGLSRRAIDSLKERGVRLLITVDTGITAIQECAYAKEHGMDIIITDHHHLRAELPQVIALLHPALAPHYPPPLPSGAGVVFSLISALEGNSWAGRETDLALATMGTIADLVELSGPNRTLVREGLQAIHALTDGPLAAMAASVRSGERPLTSTDIAFRLAPRINAAGRMDDPLIALKALLEGGKALELLEDFNARRQHSMHTLLLGALSSLNLPEQLSPDTSLSLPPLLSTTASTYPEGIIGLIAGRLTEMFGRPSLVASMHDGTCTASLRSPPCYHVAEGLERCEDLLMTFGGHAQAAGCTFATENLGALVGRLQADIVSRTRPEDLLPTLSIEASLHPQEISLAFCEHLQHLEPFGQGNPEPLFLLPNVRLEGARRVGNDGAHLQGRIAGHKAIGFRLGHLLDHAAQPLHVAFKLSIDSWNGRSAPQVIIEDLRAPLPAKLPLQSPVG